VYKEYLSAIGITLTFMAYIPYIRSILNNEIKPHVFSWGIWGVTTLIVFFAQLSDNGGVGAWVIGVSGTLVTAIALLAYFKKSDSSITKIDWLFLFIAIVSLFAWYFSSNALIAVIILTFMNVVGFAPTIRKSYAQPFSEGISFFIILVPRNLISIAALEHYSVTTVFFPAITALACITLISLVIYRRKSLKYKCIKMVT
jgi:hypothetical protein